jgi:hypothetical protein
MSSYLDTRGNNPQTQDTATEGRETQHKLRLETHL